MFAGTKGIDTHARTALTAKHEEYGVVCPRTGVCVQPYACFLPMLLHRMASIKHREPK